MTPRLLPCPACARHVRIIESFCPFCGSTMPLGYRGVGPAPVPRKRMGRAALAAFGAAALIGCGGDDGSVPDSAVAPAYGGPPIDSAVADGGDDGGSGDAAPDSAMPDATPADTAVAPAYGGPMPDSGADAMDDGAVGNLYGAPPEP